MLRLITTMSRAQKTRVFVTFDCLLVPVALLLAFSLQAPLGDPLTIMRDYLPALPFVMLAAGALSVWLGLSTAPLNNYEAGSINQTALAALLLTATSMLLTSILLDILPLSTQIVFGFAYFLLFTLGRAALLRIVREIYRVGRDYCRVLIYGAGATGMQLVSALRNHREIEPVAFVDDSQALQGQYLMRLPVLSPVRIAEIVAERRVDRVLLAMPSQSHPKQMQLARRLQKMGLEVQTVPSFAQLIGEEELVDKLTTVNAKTFLGRAEVSADIEPQLAAYSGRCVLVTGAGGSIGSELCRQVLECRPAKLVLFELSEVALYNVNAELQLLAEGSDIEIVPLLGSVTDPRQIRRALEEHQVQVVLHAAAYKHVSLVESNPLSGLTNNVLGTHTLVTEAAEAGVERFVLISSDKAVRPANIMGASKRLAELVVQDTASRRATPRGLVFSIVRFGNVLGSSGSVVPLFQDQLRRGGPLTVTHRDVARYFMTVQEAVHLVLQAGSIATGGETFVLDMGEPVKIAALARQVIEGAGYTVRDENNPDGDIEIEFVGLRPGEKMTEELTLSGTLIGTGHQKIFYTVEERLSEIEVASVLRALRQALAATDDEAARAVVLRWVDGFQANVVAPAIPDPAPDVPDRIKPVS
ncbi:MAG: nucleoside-diphosphate sugar epimerase/dehydratase [Pseudomonadota bacterium]